MLPTMNPKTAQTLHPILPILRERWSPRHYEPGTITEEEMSTILEAATWAFSGGNLQPWYYLYAHRGTSGFDKIFECLAPGNQSWAKNATVLMVSLAKLERDPGKPNLWSKHDLGAANLALALQARSMNIYAHPMGGFDAARVYETLGVDSSVYEPVACLALGFPGDPDLLDEAQRAKELAPRTRKPISEISRNIG